MNRLIIRAALASLSCLLVASVSFSGIRWETTKTSGGAAGEAPSMFYYMPGKMKMVEGGDGRFAIIRLDQEVMIMGDPAKKIYYQMTFAEMEQMMATASKAMDAQREAMREQLATLPEEQRKMAEEMMGSRMQMQQPKIEVSKTDESKTVGGYPCTKYIVNQNGAAATTVWATTEIPGFEGMRKDMQEFAERMKEMTKGMYNAEGGLTEGVDGFPIVTESADGTRVEVTKLDQADTPSPEFEPPAGYQKQDMSGLMDSEK